MNSPMDDIRIERLTSKYLKDELAAAHEFVEHTMPWMEWCHPDLTLEELMTVFNSIEKDWEQGDAYTFAILHTESKAFLGTVGLNRINKAEKTANLHYWVRAGCTGQGRATEAARLVVQFGLSELGFQRIGIIVPEGNRSSEKVAERLGAYKEGIMRNVCRIHDRQMNATVYSLIPSDFDEVLANSQRKKL